MTKLKLNLQKLKGQPRHWMLFGICMLLGIALSTLLPSFIPLPVAPSLAAKAVQPLANGMAFEQQGTAGYEVGNYAQAVEAWKQAIAAYRAMGDGPSLARTLSNLSLAQQQLGHWSEARDAITQSLAVLQTHNLESTVPSIWAQALNTQGNLQFGLGRMEAAIASWEEATAAYEAADDPTGALQSQMNLAQALKSAGFYQRAHAQLSDVITYLGNQPDSQLKAAAWRQWGDVLRLVGELEASEAALTQSLALAQTLEAKEETAAALLGLGNTQRVQQNSEAAQAFYQQAIALNASPNNRVLAQLALLSLWVEQKQWSNAQSLWPTIEANLQLQSISHGALYNQINLALSLMRLKQAIEAHQPQLTWRKIATLLFETAAQAKDIGDQRGQSYALGYLGSVYEHTQQWSTAQSLTEQALSLAQMIRAADAVYLWQWQLGRLLKAQDQSEVAIAAYAESINTLKSLRNDLATIHADVQFSFQENVEPVYRELVSLLLQPEGDHPPTSEKLAQAREVIESLQLAELDNYFQEACLQGQLRRIDQLETQSAVLYPIILQDRLEIILSLPEGEFRHYTSPISAVNLDQLVQQFRQNLVILSRRDFYAPAQQLYNLLVRPAIADLRDRGTETLVFVLDGPLKSIPMAALHDGQQYLIEEFAIALSPGLELIDPQPLSQQTLTILAAGLTEGRQGFQPLTYVETELETIREVLPQGASLIDESFTKSALQGQIEVTDFPVVHIATHGQFSSNQEQTFLVAWDDRINVSELSRILQVDNLNPGNGIELLVLSACQTAAGDKQAALGLAGFAIKAGARSTLATLWSVNDAATSEFMSLFYEELVQSNAARAGALRQAQLAFLADPVFKHPLYWAPFVLLGSWL